ncbi:MAG: hypothetical protein C4543_09530 [Ignavibacteriales bacterium]|jgi:hypothetical protein|nr:MAG: hypothetical protein C4543_09530 [Ignavibacteriales bacterium]
MKKMIMLLLMLFLLYGCETKDLESIYREIHPQYEGYATQITIEEDVSFIDTLPQKSFAVSIQKITYHPMTKTISITYEIYDGSYQQATYMTVGREGESMNEDETYLYTLTSNKGTFTTYFHGVDLSEPFHILFGKYDLDDLNPTWVIQAVKSVTFTDNVLDERQPIEMDSYLFDQSTDFTREDPIRIGFDYTIDDPSEGITHVSFVLIEDSTKVEVEKLDYPIDDDMRFDNLIEFEDIIFDNVAPGVSYDVVVLVTGSDGIDSFTDIPLTVFDHTVGSYLNNEHPNSWHGLYAAITDIYVEGDEVVVHYMLHNDHTMKDEFGHEPIIDLSFVDGRYYTLVNLTEMQPGQGSFRILKEYFKDGAQISIYIREGYKNLAHYSFYPNKLSFALNILSSNSLSFYLLNEIAPTDPITIELITNEDTILETLTFTPLSGANTLTTSINMLSYANLTARITYQSETILGTFTHEMFYTLR